MHFENMCDNNCAICLDELRKDFSCLPCGHPFHGECLKNLMATSRSACPMCRIPFQKPIQVYFEAIEKCPDNDDVQCEYDISVLKEKYGVVRNRLKKLNEMNEKLKTQDRKRFHEMKVVETEMNDLRDMLVTCNNNEDVARRDTLVIQDKLAKEIDSHLETKRLLQKFKTKSNIEEYSQRPSLGLFDDSGNNELPDDIEELKRIIKAQHHATIKRMERSKLEYNKLKEGKTELSRQYKKLEHDNIVLHRRSTPQTERITDRITERKLATGPALNPPKRTYPFVSAQPVPKRPLISCSINKTAPWQVGFASNGRFKEDKGQILRSGVNHLGSRVEFIVPQDRRKRK